jgi:serine/threonine protein kinase
MLSIALNSSVTNPNYDRRHKIGAGPPSDVWSIGCLFFELLTGEYLFVDTDWSRFFLRITNSNGPLLTERDISLLGNEEYRKFLEFVLQRSGRQRPNLSEVIVRFDEMFPDAANGELPELTMPRPGSQFCGESSRFLFESARQVEDSSRLIEDSSRLIEDSSRLIEDSSRLVEDSGRRAGET